MTFKVTDNQYGRLS